MPQVTRRVFEGSVAGLGIEVGVSNNAEDRFILVLKDRAFVMHYASGFTASDLKAVASLFNMMADKATEFADAYEIEEPSLSGRDPRLGSHR